MPIAADRTRVHLAAGQALREQENLNQAEANCHDQALRALLRYIGRRQARHAQRLMGWLPPCEYALADDRQDASEPAQQGQTHHESLGAAGAIPAAEPATDAGAVNEAAQGKEPLKAPAAARSSGGGEVTVTELQRITPDLLRLKVPRPEDFHFVAGQSVKLELEGIRRAYSIVSAPHEQKLEFFIELVPGGEMSARLQRLKVGDQLGLGTPKGGLRLDTGYANHLMVATVTGINPFVSMVRDTLHRGLQGHRFHLLHGASYQTEFGYRDELEAMAATHPGLLTYLPTISRPGEPANAGWSGSSGRVHTLIDEYLNQVRLDSSTTALYACGHSGLLEAVRRDYGPRGFRIRTESYD